MYDALIELYNLSLLEDNMENTKKIEEYIKQEFRKYGTNELINKKTNKKIKFIVKHKHIYNVLYIIKKNKLYTFMYIILFIMFIIFISFFIESFIIH